MFLFQQVVLSSGCTALRAECYRKSTCLLEMIYNLARNLRKIFAGCASFTPEATLINPFQSTNTPPPFSGLNYCTQFWPCRIRDSCLTITWGHSSCSRFPVQAQLHRLVAHLCVWPNKDRTKVGEVFLLCLCLHIVLVYAQCASTTKIPLEWLRDLCTSPFLYSWFSYLANSFLFVPRARVRANSRKVGKFGL